MVADNQPYARFITSQGDTAPKLLGGPLFAGLCFITSQGDTAPKQSRVCHASQRCFITSQGDTAPKPDYLNA